MRSDIKEFDKIIFDMDGVLTSEENYWNSAALAIYELLESKNYFGNNDIDAGQVFCNTSKIRRELFCDDKTIVTLKNCGVNSNWDLAYLVLAGIIGLETNDYEYILNYYKQIDLNPPEIYDNAEVLLRKKFNSMDCSRTGSLWATIQKVFNEWYYGDKYFDIAYGSKPRQPGKKGFIENELPMHPLKDTINLLETLISNGITLGIGTGRPQFELDVPLKNCGMDKYFNKNNCITHDDIVASGEKLNMFLAKPNPFTFLKAAFGRDFDDNMIACGDYDKDYIKKVLIVGDAGADILAAQAMGAKFAAVLTGINGINARKYFEDLNADFIFDNVLELGY